WPREFLIGGSYFPAGSADGDRLEAARRIHEPARACDDAQFLGAGGGGALDHGEHRGRRMRERLWWVLAAHAPRGKQRGEEIAGSVWTDRNARRAHAPRGGVFDSQRLDRVSRRAGRLGAGDDDRRGTARDQRARLREHLIERARLRAAQRFELEMI